jgi:hypothetical protein
MVPGATSVSDSSASAKMSTILRLIREDQGLSSDKKNHLLTMLNSPEMYDHLLVGALGMVVARAVSSYAEMSKPARILLSLAGYGIGNIIYNALHERKHTTYNPQTGVATIKLL